MKHLLEQHLQNREAPARGDDPQFDREVDAGVAWFMNLANAAAQDDTVAATDATTDNVVAFRPRPVQTFALMAAGSAEDQPWFEGAIRLRGFQLLISPLKSDETMAVIQIDVIEGEEADFDALFGQDQGEIPISMYWKNELLLRGQLLISDDERSGTGKGTIYRRICSFSEQFSIRFDPLD